jgi:hypothetical protein
MENGGEDGVWHLIARLTRVDARNALRLHIVFTLFRRMAQKKGSIK